MASQLIRKQRRANIDIKKKNGLDLSLYPRRSRIWTDLLRFRFFFLKKKEDLMQNKENDEKDVYSQHTTAQAAPVSSSVSPVAIDTSVIILDHERIRGFFAAHPYVDPTRFVLSCISKFQDYMYIDETTHVLNHETLLSLKDEFMDMNHRKRHATESLKTFYREQLQLIEHLQTPSVELYLRSKFTEEELELDAINIHRCSKCERASFPNKKALAVHRRYCLEGSTPPLGGGREPEKKEDEMDQG